MVLLSFSPNKEERHTFEGIDEGKKEVLNEELVMTGIEFIEGSHKGN
jgi:hypothetical protein